MIIDGVEYNVKVTTEGTPSRLFIELKVWIPLPLGEYAEINCQQYQGPAQLIDKRPKQSTFVVSDRRW
ncbi:hypothetical protein LCGC14_0923530 [marine sediment metagenome]|uniref:Uncharacterized protein n=1 Tax=marine sediment metagenome TaxID=412755 RepID=A0A0F9R8S0_9ZZZZ